MALCHYWFLPALTVVTLSRSDISLPSSCLGQNNGPQWLKLLGDSDSDSTYPAIHQFCNNEFMVIDVNEDPAVEDYFTSFTAWHYALSGPEQMDAVNWEEWWRPSARFLGDEVGADHDEYFQFAISPDCSTCDLENNIKNNAYSLFNDDDSGERTAYYMTGTLFGCMAKHKAMKDCRWDYASYECAYCSEDDTVSDLGYTVMFPGDDDWDRYVAAYDNAPPIKSWLDLQVSLCGVTPTSSFSDMVPSTRDECNTFQDNIKPSIGNNGRFCVCVKPHESYDEDSVFPISERDFKAYQKAYTEFHTESVGDSDVVDGVVTLYQSDFEWGTYRIQKSGTYVLMEDITFDFNAGDLEHPNDGDMQWWPRSDQLTEYPGAGTTEDEYYLGFIAGITVEVDDVVIDLNGFTVAMSRALYYQQRFFSCIALKSVAFPLNQGPGFFGFDPKFANNVVIKNGNIGLSSHHGIHGHYNKDVVIEDVHIYDFETHGVQMSYFENLKMKNVEIGPSSTIAYLKGEYAYARWTVQALERIQESGDFVDIFPVTFSGRKVALEFDDIIDELRDLMDIAFKSVMGIEQYADHDPQYRSARDLFINEDGLPYGAVMYGLFLNLWVSNVFNIHPSNKFAAGAEIENLKIHGLHHKTMEYRRLDCHNGGMYRNQFNAPLDADALLGPQINGGYYDIVWSEVDYVGSALTDAEILLSMVTEQWGELGLIFTTDNFTGWALGEYSWPNDSASDDVKNDYIPYIGCNNDRMAHVPKGTIGIRMDGVENVVFDGLTISDLHEQSQRGSDLCGEYWDEGFADLYGKGNTLQNSPYLYGYTGNRVHGIFSDFSEYTFAGDVAICDLICDTGLVRGVGMYRQTTLKFAEGSTLSISDLSAGHELYTEDTSEYAKPYNPSEAKPFHFTETESVNVSVNKYSQLELGQNWGDYKVMVFNSSISGKPDSVAFSCIFGRDGVDTSDWTVDADNSDCGEFGGMMEQKETISSMLQQRTSTEGGGIKIDSIVLAVFLLIFILVAGRVLNGSSEGSPRKPFLVNTETAPLLEE